MRTWKWYGEGVEEGEIEVVSLTIALFGGVGGVTRESGNIQTI